MRQLTAQEWQRLNAAAQQGDRIAYWRVLQDAGDRYAFVAGQIVLGASFAGRVANNHLASVGGLNAQGVHAFGQALLRADFDERIQASGVTDRAQLMDPQSGAAASAAAPVLSARAIRDSHAAAAVNRNVTADSWAMEPIMAAFQNNPAASEQIWNRFVDLALAGRPLAAGSFLRGLQEGLIMSSQN